jgi:hypothetical protein
MSRRTLRDIELQTAPISTFANIFHQHYLGMFSNEDVEAYFTRLSSIGASVPATAKERMLFYCGGHPYLLEMLGYEVVEVFREEQEVEVDRAAHHIAQSFFDQ